MDRAQTATKTKLEVLVLNEIAPLGLQQLPAERYAVVKASTAPDAILVRSRELHGYEFGARLKAVGRAGAGVNNIPVAELSVRGVPVFNAPGANANAVKELVLAGMLMAARNLAPALDFVRGLDPAATDLGRRVEDGKKRFAGIELPGHTLGVVGLGKIGSLVADAAIRLGMNVLGYDPEITVDAAWSLPSQVRRAASIEEVLKASHFITLHVPLHKQTRHLLNAGNVGQSRPGADSPQFLARRRGRRWGGARGPAQRPAEVLRHGFPERRSTARARRGGAAASRGIDRRGRGKQRRDGGQSGARLSRARQPAQRGQFPRGLDAPGVPVQAGDRQRQRPRNAGAHLARSRRAASSTSTTC